MQAQARTLPLSLINEQGRFVSFFFSTIFNAGFHLVARFLFVHSLSLRHTLTPALPCFLSSHQLLLFHLPELFHVCLLEHRWFPTLCAYPIQMKSYISQGIYLGKPVFTVPVQLQRFVGSVPRCIPSGK